MQDIQSNYFKCKSCYKKISYTYGSMFYNKRALTPSNLELMLWSSIHHETYSKTIELLK